MSGSGRPFAFDLLAQANIPTLQPASKTLEISDDNRAVWAATIKVVIADILKRVPESASVLSDGRPEFQCDPGSKLLIDYISQIYQWDGPQGRRWLLQSVCFAGSANMLNYSDMVLVSEESGGARIASIDSALASKMRTMEVLDRANYAIFPHEDGHFFVASRIGRFAALINGRNRQRVGPILEIVQPELLAELRRTVDGKHVVQLNNDKQFFVYRLSDGKQIFRGALADNEVIAVTDDGFFDSSYEGATSVQVRFPGVAGLYTFHQFDSLLRRKDLSRRLLAGEQLEPKSKNFRSPPRVQLNLSSTAKQGRRLGQVSISSEQDLSQIRYYVDGLLVKSTAISGSKVDLPVDIADPGGARWVSAVAIDQAGLVSLPSSIRIPGSPIPSGSLRSVLVGIDDYEDRKLSKLKYAQSDARNLATALSTSNRAFQSVEKPQVFLNEATPQTILSAVRAAASKTLQSDTLLVFFAGHGLDGRSTQQNAGLALATSKTKLGDLQNTAVSWTALASAMAEAKGKIIIILDACHSGIAGSETATSNDAIVDSLVSRGGAPMVILAGSKARQNSGEDSGGGYFTSAIVAALTIERDAADRNRSGLLDLGELYQTVKLRVNKQSKQSQSPWLARNALVGEMSLF